MRISDKKAMAVYTAISDPIDTLRVENSVGSTVEEMDLNLYNLRQEIWDNIIKALNLEVIR